MDFLDPVKQKAHKRRLIAGYILIGMVLVLASIILLYQVFGYGIDRHGRIFQNGLVFISSLPDNAEVYVNDKRQESTTNTRLVMPAGQYVFELRREGYRTWKRAITVEGSSVQRFDYPLLFADNLETSTVKQYAAPGLATQSPDRRWLLAQNDTANSFDLLDINEQNPTPTTLTLPIELLSAGTVTTGWQEVEWSKDNRHVLLRRLFTRAGLAAREYILVDRENANAAVNLSVRLGFTPSVLQLRDKAYDRYYALDQSNGLLFTATLEQPTPQPYLEKVLAFQSEGADSVLYATSQDAPTGKTLIRIRQGEDHFTVRQVDAAAAPYLLDLARYDDAWYVAAGASGEDRVYVYKNPVEALKTSGDVLVPVHILKTVRPTYVAFSPESRFVMAEGGQDFGVYDVKNNNGYNYLLEEPLAAGHVTWSNEYHLAATTTAGQAIIFDYDGTNSQLLSAGRPGTTPFFNDTYRWLYGLTATNSLDRTELRAERDR